MLFLPYAAQWWVFFQKASFAAMNYMDSDCLTTNRGFSRWEILVKKREMETQATEVMRPLGCRLGKEKNDLEQQTQCPALGRAGGPRGLVKQQGKNVLDAGMVYWLQTDKQRGQLCHQFMFYWNCQYRGGAPAGFSQWRAAWCSLDKVTCSADLARSLFSAEPNSWDLWRSLLFLRTREHLYRVACCSSKSGRTIFQQPLHSES